MSVRSHRKSPIFSYMQEAPWKTQLIILGASGKSSWVPNTTPVSLKKKQVIPMTRWLQSNLRSGFARKLFPSIQPNSLIIMDNASYHSHRSEPLPVLSWTKKWMQEWLPGKEMEFPPESLQGRSLQGHPKPCPHCSVCRRWLGPCCG